MNIEEKYKRLLAAVLGLYDVPPYVFTGSGACEQCGIFLPITPDVDVSNEAVKARQRAWTQLVEALWEIGVVK